MSHKQSVLGVGKFYTAGEALTHLTNMNDFEDESTSESEIESDSSNSSEYAPEQQYQVRTDSNIQMLLPKETVNQNATKCAQLADKTATHQVRNMLLHPKKYLMSKKFPQRAKKLHQNWFLKSVLPQKASTLPDEGAMASDDIIPPSPNSILFSVSCVPLTRKIEPVTLLDLDPDSDDLPVTG